MKKYPLKITVFLMFVVFAYLKVNAQQGTVTINQSAEIDALLKLNKDINIASDRYKIQIYSGNRAAAEAALLNFNGSFPQYTSSLEYETPNFKIWIGNFRSRLEADRALLDVKRKFTSAFIFKPSKSNP